MGGVIIWPSPSHDEEGKKQAMDSFQSIRRHDCCTVTLVLFGAGCVCSWFWTILAQDYFISSKRPTALARFIARRPCCLPEPAVPAAAPPDPSPGTQRRSQLRRASRAPVIRDMSVC